MISKFIPFQWFFSEEECYVFVILEGKQRRIMKRPQGFQDGLIEARIKSTLMLHVS